MKRHTFDEISKLDDAIYQLALYAITEGMLIIPKSAEDALDLQHSTAHKFNEFKRLIQNSECTFDYLRWTVLDKYGPFPRRKEALNPVEIQETLDRWKEEDAKALQEHNDGLNMFIHKIIKSTIADKDDKPSIEPSAIPPKMTIDDLKRKKKKRSPKKQ